MKPSSWIIIVAWFAWFAWLQTGVAMGNQNQSYSIQWMNKFKSTPMFPQVHPVFHQFLEGISISEIARCKPPGTSRLQTPGHIPSPLRKANVKRGRCLAVAENPGVEVDVPRPWRLRARKIDSLTADFRVSCLIAGGYIRLWNWDTGDIP